MHADNDRAKRLLQELGEGFSFDEKRKPSQLSDSQLLRIHNLFREAKFEPPTGKTLSPAGEYNLRLGVIKEMQPVLTATHQGEPSVYQGHSFQVEAAVSIGGNEVKAGMYGWMEVSPHLRFAAAAASHHTGLHALRLSQERTQPHQVVTGGQAIQAVLTLSESCAS